MSEKLKPCPFCGNTPLIAQCSRFGDCDWIVSCESNCLVGPMTNNLTREEAIAAWNTRAPDEQIRKLREALREYRRNCVNNGEQPCDLCKDTDALLEATK